MKKSQANRIEALRKERRYSQELLATLSGVSIRTIGRLEAGEAVNANTLNAVAKALGVSAPELRQELNDSTEHDA